VVEAYAPFTIDPSAVVLHYAQTIFEGLKAYRQADGSIASFRPEQNAARLRSAERLAMPRLPEELFMESLRQLVAIDRDWVPAAGGEEALYLRPFMIATETGLGVRPADEYLYSVIASPAGAYFSRGVAPVSVWLSTEFVRASPGGTGAAKFGGNYAASLRAQEQATAEGCDQVVWLDAIERKYIEEMGGMNLFFVLGSGDSAEIVTPELSGSLLPGVPAPRVPGHRAQDLRPGVGVRCGLRRDHRGVRVRHRRRDHPGRVGQARRGRVHGRRRRAGRDHDAPARDAHRDPARIRGGHVRLDDHPGLTGPV